MMFNQTDKTMTPSEHATYEKMLELIRDAPTDEAAYNASEVLSVLMHTIVMRVESGVKMPKEV